MKKRKLKVGVFSFTCCEGCQLAMLQAEKKFIDLLEMIKLDYSRLLREKNELQHFDVAIVEGSIVTTEEAEMLKEIRKKSDILIALGACAHPGGIPATRNTLLKEEQEAIRNLLGDGFKKKVYGLKKYVKVDLYIRGCPIDENDFLDVLVKLCHGIKPVQHEVPVCFECRAREKNCLLLEGKPCLGPITHGNCNAVCPNEGFLCNGCRGFLKDANFDSLKKVLKDNKVSDKEIEALFNIFNSVRY